MKYSYLMLSVLAANIANASVEMEIVTNYDKAGKADIWKGIGADEIPKSMLSKVTTENPSSSYSTLFPNSFLQQDLFAVCFEKCSKQDIFKVNSDEIQKIVYTEESKWNVIEQTTVYYWLNKYFDFIAERFNQRSNTYLKVYTNRNLEKDNGEGIMMNNAFFNPLDTTLSFLPAQKNLLFKLVAGKLNRSGFDPSVIAHEASHFFFSQLYPNAINNEITGLNEGFADYIANIFLNNPKIGLVMMHGKVLRDASNPLDINKKAKVYGIGMESHQLGERVSLALWKTRELATNPEEFDNIVIDAIKELAQTPYSTIHNFKQKMLKRLDHTVAAENLEKAQMIWEGIFPGKAIKIKNLNFLEKVQTDYSYANYKITKSVRESLANEMGLQRVKEQKFTVIDTDTISEYQKAVLIATEKNNLMTPYWIVLDTARNNTLGIYKIDGTLVNSKEELADLSDLTKELINSADDLFGFVAKLNAFVGLAEKQGELKSIYKVTKKVLTDRTVVLNGDTYVGKEIKMDIKKKILGKLLSTLLPNIENITKISLIGAKLSDKDAENYPSLEGVSILGYKVEVVGQNSVEIILEENNDVQ